jgi:hypothetical protein
MLAVGAKLLGVDTQDTQETTTATTTEQPSAQPASAFEVGRTDWHKWHDWEAGLSGDKLAGVQFWADVRSQRPQASCAAGRGQYSAEFRDGCETARRYLTEVDKARLSNNDYRQGWNAGAKETGDF